MSGRPALLARHLLSETFAATRAQS